MTVSFICPLDRSPLDATAVGEATCKSCGRTYPVSNGVLRLLDRDDPFYEGAYQNRINFVPRSERPWHAWPLWLINSGYLWMVRRHVVPGSITVDLGCAAGVRYFARRYRMIGCDLSLSSLYGLDVGYEHRLQADANACIPLADGTADAVISSYFWEHVRPHEKRGILAECHRILRPEGKLVFLYDVENDNPLIARYRAKDPALYRRLFIEGDGHHGYESPSENAAAFREAGFEILEHSLLEKTWLQAPSVYAKLSEFGGRAQRLLRWSSVLARPALFYPYTALMRLVDAWAGPWLPERWGRVAIVVCKRGPA